MTIFEFVNDRKKTFSWLAEQRGEIEAMGHYFSDWPHDPGGFGLVLSGHERSGELHLTADGVVTYHIETSDSTPGQISVLEQVTRQANSFNDFEYVYRRFRSLILGSAPKGLSAPNPRGTD
jgi:hypothetical protein